MSGNRRPPYYLTAYGLAVQMGFEGTVEEWLDSLVGPMPEIQIGKVETLDGGSAATVTVGGTKEKPTLNFGIPRGLGMVDALPLVGGFMEGNINMNGQKITGLNAPTSGDEPATKAYADDAAKKLCAAACGSSSALTLPQGEITPMTLDTWRINSDDAFTFSDGGIMAPKSGTVLICASVYFNNISTSAPASIGPYVKHNGAEIAGQLFYSESTTAVSLPPVLVEVAEGDVLTLHARNTTRDGSCIPNAKATALTVIYL